MGLFDIAAGILTGNGPQDQQGDPKSMLMQAVLGLVSNPGQNGGLQSVLAKFQEAGFGDKLASWIGQGENLPISADQVRQVLGGGHLEEMADCPDDGNDQLAKQ